MMKLRSRLFLATLVFVLLANSAFASDAKFGKFNGRVLAVWLRNEKSDHREMQLAEEFEYIDPSGNSWKVPKDAIIDGASIPKLFWQIIGPPFVGSYREASVVHDYYCKKKNKPWKEVHRMFYYASLANGVPKAKANLMYAAVYSGGPRWETINTAPTTNLPNGDSSDSLPRSTSSSAKIILETEYDREELEQQLESIESQDLDLNEIEEKLNPLITEKAK